MSVNVYMGSAGAPGDPLLDVIVVEGRDERTLQFSREAGGDLVVAQVRGSRGGKGPATALTPRDVADLIAALTRLQSGG